MNAPLEGRSLATIERTHTTIPAFAIPESELLATLGDSIYPGAKPESIRMVINYCKANLLDPFQKPVHIVPMSRKVKGKNGQKDEYVDVDTIMPGIGLYRTQAARSGEHAGTSEPEYGPMQKATFKEEYWEENELRERVKKSRESSLEHPEWCKVTVFRLDSHGQPRAYVSLEYWIENYGTASRYTTAPNAMWKKRTRGQLAKCAEAQALRKAFPELGAAPTADEMEGKWIDESGEVTTGQPARTQGPLSKDEAAKSNVIDVEAGKPKDGEAAARDLMAKHNVGGANGGNATNGGGGANGEAAESPAASDGMLRLIRAKMAAVAVDELAFCKEHGIEALPGINVAKGSELIKALDALKAANA